MSAAGSLTFPLRLVLGPIFHAQVRISGRRKSTYWLRGLYTIGLLAFIVLAFALAVTNTPMSGSRAARLQALQSVAPLISVFLCWFQFFALGLMAPVLTAPAIADERRKRTLSTLLTTPLSALQIVLGKLSAGVFQLLIYAMIPLPLLLTIRVFGGLDAEFVLGATALSISTGILAASLGVMFSVWHKRSSSAVLFAYFTAALLVGAPMTVVFIRAEIQSAAPGFGLMWTCAPGVMVMLSADVMEPSAGRMFGVSIRETWIWCSLFNSGLGLLIAAFAAHALRKTMLRDEAGQDSVVLLPTSLGGRGKSSAEKRPRERTSRQVGDSPVRWREMRQPMFESTFLRRAVFTITTLGLGGLYLAFGVHDAGLHPTIVLICLLAVLFQCVLTTTSGLSGEREAETLSALLTTPLTPREIVMGKFWGAIRRLWFFPAVMMIDLVIGIVVGDLRPILVVHQALVYSGPMVFFCAAGVYLSIGFRRSLTASVLNLCVALGLWIGLLLGVGVLTSFWPPWDYDIEPLIDCVLLVNPVAMGVTAFDGVEAMGRGRFYPAEYDMPTGEYSLGQFSLALSVVWLAYVLGGVAALWRAVAVFPRKMGRPS